MGTVTGTSDSSAYIYRKVYYFRLTFPFRLPLLPSFGCQATTLCLWWALIWAGIHFSGCVPDLLCPKYAPCQFGLENKNKTPYHSYTILNGFMSDTILLDSMMSTIFIWSCLYFIFLWCKYFLQKLSKNEIMLKYYKKIRCSLSKAENNMKG